MVWAGQSVLDAARVAVPPRLAESLARAAERIGWDASVDGDWSPTVARVRHRLDIEPGFAVISGLRIPDADLVCRSRRQAWLFGCMVGETMPQDVHGTVIYDVIDKGGAIVNGARFSVTNQATGFHTDNSYEVDVPRYIALYCVQRACAGGASELVSGRMIVRRLEQSAPDLASRLHQPFPFHRRGGVVAGELEFSTFPVICEKRDGTLIRYLRYYIDCGYEKAGYVMDELSRNALDAFDAVANEDGTRVALTLSPGEMLLINNRSILHGRTEYVDSVQERRRLVRVWLTDARSPVKLRMS